MLRAKRTGPVPRREALARLTVFGWALLVGCRQDARPTVLRGVIVDVQATLVQIGSFMLRTDAGETFELFCQGEVGISPSHLREHMALAEPVTVTLRYEGDRMIALQVDD